MSKHKLIRLLLVVFLTLVVGISLQLHHSTPKIFARDSTFTEHGSGPLYWTDYMWDQQNNKPEPESLWQENIDWVANNFKSAGYTMVTTDGWGPAAQPNSNGYATSYTGWTHDYSYYVNYLAQKGLQLGLYQTPMWITYEMYNLNPQIEGTSYHLQSVAGPDSGMGWYWLDPSKPGAQQWVEGYVKYYINLGVKMLTMDFLSDYEGAVGSANYATALSWVAEAAGNSILIKLDMNNCYNNCSAETKYLDDMRVSADVGVGNSWDALSSRGRSSDGNPVNSGWPRFNNAWDGFNYDSQFAGKSKLILDGDFLSMNNFSTNAERQTAISIYAMSGSPIGIMDYCSTTPCSTVTPGSPDDFYRNPEVTNLYSQGFVGHPLNGDGNRWVGQLSDGSWVVGLFNREDTNQTRSINFASDLGLSGSQHVHDMWLHCDVGSQTSYSANLSPHASVLLHIGGAAGTGCVNLLQDPSFEQQTSSTLSSPWNTELHDAANASAGVDINKGNASNGNNNAWIYDNGNIAAGTWSGVGQTISVQPNTTYTLSVDTYNTVGSIGNNAVLIATDPSWTNINQVQFTPSTTGYSRQTLIFTTTANETSMVIAMGYNAPSGGQPTALRIDNFSMPAPSSASSATLIQDPSYEQQTSATLSSPWVGEFHDSNHAWVGVDINKGNASNGNNNAWIYDSGSIAAGTWTAVAQTITVQPNTSYTLSVDTYNTVGAIGNNAVLIATDPSWSNINQVQFTPSTTGYTTHTLTFTTGASETSMVIAMGYNAPGGSQDTALRVDNWSMH